MTVGKGIAVLGAVCGATVVAIASHVAPAPDAPEWARPVRSHDRGRPVATLPPMDPDTLIQEYCVDCHNDVTKAGSQSFETFVIADTAKRADVAERMVRKLQAGMMPPPGTTPPDAASLQGLIDTLESRLDAAAHANPNPGRRVFPRLNRAEYARSVREILDLEVDPGQWRPLDTMNANFDMGRPAAFAAAVRLHGLVPHHLPQLHHRAGELPRRAGRPVAEDRQRGLQEPSIFSG